MLFTQPYEQVTKGFSCPYCKAFSAHTARFNMIELKDSVIKINDSDIAVRYFNITAKCHSCNQESIWFKRDAYKDKDNEEYALEILVYPIINHDVPEPNLDMPESVKQIYDEACSVLYKSPRSSAALSRLAIENLVDCLNANGKDLNTKIGDLVSKGMPVSIQQMLDSVRVIGNNAVHPGQIEISDNIELALSLLNFINLIVDNTITQPKKINEVYNLLPDSYKQSIERRDSQNSNP